MSARPGKVMGDVKIEIPHPRLEYLTDPLYFRLVDEIMKNLNLENRKQ
ncbi:MAG: hypothetical protein NTY03_13710 [Candidatus Bathyarchaeota archaeon]|nr:hypothetical protein [Candidatus Bathyarchaeota archaeon]